MPKKIRTTTVTVDEEPAVKKPPFYTWIKNYIDTTEFEPELENYQYKITVQVYNKDGRPITDTGRIYEDLRSLPFDIGRRHGSGRYRLYIEVYKEGKKYDFVKILDAEFGYTDDPDEDPAGDTDDPDPQDLSPTMAAALEERRFQHEKELKQMEINKEMFIAAMNAKGSGGGLKVADMLELIQTGVALGSGRVPAANDGDGGDDGDGIMNLLNNPLLKTIAGLLNRPPAIPPVPTTSPAHPGAIDGVKTE